MFLFWAHGEGMWSHWVTWPCWLSHLTLLNASTDKHKQTNTLKAYIKVALIYDSPHTPQCSLSLILSATTSSLFLLLAIQHTTSIPLLVLDSALSPDYAPSIVLPYKSLWMIVLPHSLSPIFGMLHILSPLGKQRPLPRWLDHFRISPTSPSQPKLFDIAWRIQQGW